jgi:hypothetical protein
MKMLNISGALLSGIDALNTINGGTAEPRLHLTEQPGFREIRLSVPGVEVENCRAEVHNNQLTVYYLLPGPSQGVPHFLPMVVYNKTIPYFIDTKGIRAQIEDGDLVVRLPFNEFANGYHKDLMNSTD